MFAPFEHAKFVGDAWKGHAPRFNLGSSGYMGGSWQERGLGPIPQDVSLGDLNLVAQPETTATLAKHLNLSQECVLPTAGTSAANTAVVLRHQGRMLCERPYYAPISGLAKGLGHQVDWLDDCTAEGVRAALKPDTKLVVFTSPNNPTGISQSPAEWVRIAEEAAEVGAMVLVDQVYGDLTEPTVAGLHPNLVSTSGLNKAWGAAALRFGWIAASAEHMETYGDIHRYTALGPSPIGEKLAGLLLPQKERCKNQLLGHLKVAHKTYNDWIETVPLEGQATWLTVFPNLKRNTASVKSLLNEGILLLPGEYFGKPGHARIGLGGSGLQESLEALSPHVQ